MLTRVGDPVNRLDPSGLDDCPTGADFLRDWHRETSYPEVDEEDNTDIRSVSEEFWLPDLKRNEDAGAG